MCCHESIPDPVQAGDGGEAPAQKPDWLPEGCEMLADGEYDAIVMGTGLKEAIMSGLLSTLGMKVGQLLLLLGVGVDVGAGLNVPVESAE